MPVLFFLCRLLGEIAGVQLVVAALLGNQLVVGTTFNDMSLFQNHNGICIADGRETVRNDEYGTSFHQSIHTFLNNGFSTGIDT